MERTRVIRCRFWPLDICLRMVAAHLMAASWERWLCWQRKSTSRPSGVVVCPVACQLGWDGRLLRLLCVEVESVTGPSRTPILMLPPALCCFSLDHVSLLYWTRSRVREFTRRTEPLDAGVSASMAAGNWRAVNRYQAETMAAQRDKHNTHTGER